MTSRVSGQPDLLTASLPELFFEDGLAIVDPRSVLPSRTGQTLIGAGPVCAPDRSLDVGTFVKAGDLLSGKYDVLSFLGRGTMSYLVAAKHRDFDCEVALKFFDPTLADHQESARRFTIEHTNNLKLRSDFIVRVFEVGALPNGQPFLVMERLDGYDMRAVLADGGVFSVARAIALVLQACEALATAHVTGMVHGNLRPENLFLVRAPGPAQLKVLGLGRSREAYASTQRVATLNAHAAPLYLAPEQLRGGSADARTDLWALGCVLYEMLSGRALYQRLSLAQACAAVLEERPPSLRSYLPTLPEALDRIVLACLEKSPEHRPANVAELAHALSAFAPPQAQLRVQRCVQIFAEHGFRSIGRGRGINGGTVRSAVNSAAPASRALPRAPESVPSRGAASSAPPRASAPAPAPILWPLALHPPVAIDARGSASTCVPQAKPVVAAEPFAWPAAQVVAPGPAVGRAQNKAAVSRRGFSTPSRAAWLTVCAFVCGSILSLHPSKRSAQRFQKIAAPSKLTSSQTELATGPLYSLPSPELLPIMSGVELGPPRPPTPSEPSELSAKEQRALRRAQRRAAREQAE